MEKRVYLDTDEISLVDWLVYCGLDSDRAMFVAFIWTLHRGGIYDEELHFIQDYLKAIPHGAYQAVVEMEGDGDYVVFKR